MSELIPPHELLGCFYQVHFNLRTHYWSVTAKSGPFKGRVVANLVDVTLADVTLVVSEAGHRRAKAEGARNVHAWARGTITVVNSTPDLAALTRVSYNPRPKDPDLFDPYFRVTANGSGVPGPIVTHAPWLVLAKPLRHADKGYAWIERSVAAQPEQRRGTPRYGHASFRERACCRATGPPDVRSRPRRPRRVGAAT